MDARPLLGSIVAALTRCRLEAVLIGNAAAALQGAPVTTIDFDFMFRKTATNLAKLRLMADELQGVLLRPYYPVSSLYRLVNDERGLQVDFMPTVHGIAKFESLRARATVLELAAGRLLVAHLDDIIRSKRAAGRPRDRAVCHPCSRRPDVPSKPRQGNARARRRQILAALKRESELELRALIERLLALPMEKRTHFLRQRLPQGGSAL